MYTTWQLCAHTVGGLRMRIVEDCSTLLSSYRNRRTAVAIRTRKKLCIISDTIFFLEIKARRPLVTFSTRPSPHSASWILKCNIFLKVVGYSFFPTFCFSILKDLLLVSLCDEFEFYIQVDLDYFSHYDINAINTSKFKTLDASTFWWWSIYVAHFVNNLFIYFSGMLDWICNHLRC